MKFDHTFIAIRQRTILEIYDLALHVCRDYFAPLTLLLIVGVLPWLALDWFLVGWMLDEAYIEQHRGICLLYTSPSPRDKRQSRMPSSA